MGGGNRSSTCALTTVVIVELRSSRLNREAIKAEGDEGRVVMEFVSLG